MSKSNKLQRIGNAICQIGEEISRDGLDLGDTETSTETRVWIKFLRADITRLSRLLDKAEKQST